jgi:hypothetical protein
MTGLLLFVGLAVVFLRLTLWSKWDPTDFPPKEWENDNLPKATALKKRRRR